MKKFLIIKTSSLGDILHCFPILNYLKVKFPSSQIDWVVERRCSSLIKTHPLITKIIEIDTQAWKKNFFKKEIWKDLKSAYAQLRGCYDYVFDLQGNIKSSLILFNIKSPFKVGFGWKLVPEKPNWFFTNYHITLPPDQNIREDYLAVVQNFFHEKTPVQQMPFLLPLTEKEQEMLAFFPERGIVVCPGSRWKNKCLSEKTLLSYLQQFENKPLLFTWGSDEEKQVCEALAAHFKDSNVLPKLSLPLLQNVMARAFCVVAMDSLPLHLCGTTNTPSLSFFGPSSSKKYKPIGKQHKSIQGACPYGITFEKRCPKLRTCKTGACLKQISHEPILD